MTDSLKCKTCLAPLDAKGQLTNLVRCTYCGTDNLVSHEVRKVLTQDAHRFATALFRAMRDAFSLDELRDVAVLLNGELPPPLTVDFENLAGSSKNAKLRELIGWCRRRAALQQLYDAARAVRPSLFLDL